MDPFQTSKNPNPAKKIRKPKISGFLIIEECANYKKNMRIRIFLLLFVKCKI
jgi:hypothetical protein